MNKLEEVIQKFRLEVGAYFLATAICGSDGMPITGSSVLPDFDPFEAAAKSAVCNGLTTSICKKLQFGDLEDLVMTSDKVIWLSRNITENYFWPIAIPVDAPVGTVRAIMKDYVPLIADAIPH